MKIPVQIYKILKITAGRFHCWCDSNVGKIKKENKNVPNHLWDEFKQGRLKEEIKLKWYQRLWNFIKKKLCLIKKYLKKQ